MSSAPTVDSVQTPEKAGKHTCWHGLCLERDAQAKRRLIREAKQNPTKGFISQKTSHNNKKKNQNKNNNKKTENEKTACLARRIRTPEKKKKKSC
jgi:hypothetical protein